MLFLTNGCGNDGVASPLGQQQDELFQGYRQPERHFVMNRRANGEYEKYNRFGFGRETDETAYSGQSVPEFAVFDRSLMAETISKLVTSLNEVREAAALVTDQHVLIVYDAVNDADRNLTATQVKKSAYSVVPGYYDVYVSDDIHYMQDIERFQGLSPREPSYADSLQATIDDLRKSPQGEAINFNDHMDREMDYGVKGQRSKQGYGSTKRSPMERDTHRGNGRNQ